MLSQKERHARYMRDYRRIHPEYNIKQKVNFQRFQMKNPEYFREHVKQWKKDHPKEAKRHQQEHSKRHPDRIKARNAARYVHISDECTVCNTTVNLEKHHPDYSKPKIVVTLCGRCNANAN